MPLFSRKPFFCTDASFGNLVLIYLVREIDPKFAMQLNRKKTQQLCTQKLQFSSTWRVRWNSTPVYTAMQVTMSRTRHALYSFISHTLHKGKGLW